MVIECQGSTFCFHDDGVFCFHNDDTWMFSFKTSTLKHVLKN